MKKILVGMCALIACAGMAMAANSKTKTITTKTEQTTPKEKRCSKCNKIIYYGTICSDCVESMNKMCTPTEDGSRSEWQKSNCD